MRNSLIHGTNISVKNSDESFNQNGTAMHPRSSEFQRICSLVSFCYETNVFM